MSKAVQPGPRIWSACGGISNFRALALRAWRVVESQHQISTRKLVDTDAEQQVLEELIESAKPRMRAPARMHYLLSTPFRYPPLRHGSRFGTRHEPGIWYGSERQRTVFAEVAYYRLLFIEGTRADLGLLETELTAFSAVIRTERGVDLTIEPFAVHRSRIAARDAYTDSQALGRDMRSDDVEAFRYPSARDVQGGVNIAVFAHAAFGRRSPRSLETWHCTATPQAVEFVRRDYFERIVHAFGRDEFLVDGSLPAPAL